MRLRSIVEDLRTRDRESIEVVTALGQETRPDRYHAVRIGKRQRPQQNAVDDREHGRRRAYAETQCEHRDEAEADTARKRACRMAQVADRSREQEDWRIA